MSNRKKRKIQINTKIRKLYSDLANDNISKKKQILLKYEIGMLKELLLNLEPVVVRIKSKKKTKEAKKIKHALVKKTVSTPLNEASKIIRSKKIIILLPGTISRGFLELIYSQKTMEYVFDPLIADKQKSYIQAELKNKQSLLFFIRVNTVFSLCITISLHGFASVGKTILNIWKAI